MRQRKIDSRIDYAQMRSVSITLPRFLIALIDDQIAASIYNTRCEVVRNILLQKLAPGVVAADLQKNPVEKPKRAPYLDAPEQLYTPVILNGRVITPRPTRSE